MHLKRTGKTNDISAKRLGLAVRITVLLLAICKGYKTQTFTDYIPSPYGLLPKPAHCLGGILGQRVCKTERPRAVRKEMHTLTLNQLTEKLLPAIAKNRLFAAIFLAFGTGLRQGEFLALRWRDVDVKAGTLHVRQTLVRITNHGSTKAEGRTRLIFQEPKTSPSRRTIPIPEECL